MCSGNADSEPGRPAAAKPESGGEPRRHKGAAKDRCRLGRTVGPLSLAPARPTPVYDAFWQFAAMRQEVFFRRLLGAPPPWTDDAILQRYKFTNVYRASDRVSQYLIREVIYAGDQSPEEVFFRVLLFKILNRISTWEELRARLGEISYSSFVFGRYDDALCKMRAEGKRVFTAAYMMPAGEGELASPRKHRSYLWLLERMMNDEVPARLVQMTRMRDAFGLLRDYPMLGDFLAYQYAIDLNYSGIVDFSEMEFVVPGPGARSGLRKCFASFGGLGEADLIRVVTERQEDEFETRGISFRSLWGRPLQLIDCQNLFCELDKYARVAFPECEGIGHRTRIKQVYRPTPGSISHWYPPKWGINHLVAVSTSRDGAEQAANPPSPLLGIAGSRARELRRSDLQLKE